MAFKQGRTIVGWGVVRLKPWEFDGIYQSKEEAEAEATKAGPDFEVYWGENQEGTDNFVFADPDPSHEEGEIFEDDDGPFLITADGERILLQDGSPIRLSGDSSSPDNGTDQELSVEELQSIDETGGPFDPNSDQLSPPPDPIRASSWTGRLTIEEQISVVKQVGPLAADFVTELIGAIEAKRLNAPDVQETLEQLRELHRALGELIKLADAGRPLGAVMEKIEAHKAKIADSIRSGTQVMLVAPSVACGTAFILSLLSGFPMSDNMVTALCATMMGKDALMTLAKR